MIEKAQFLDFVAGVVLVLGMIFILGPLYLTVVTATQSYSFVVTNGLAWVPDVHFLSNMKKVVTETDLPVQLINSIVVASSMAVATCILSFLSAYAIVYFKIRWAGVAFALILATIMLPLDIRVITTYEVASNVFSPLDALLDISGANALAARVLGAPIHLQWSILDTRLGLVAPLIAHGAGTFLFRQFFKTLPGDLAKAARMDGAGAIRFMVDIVLPLSKTSFAALFVLTFLSGWTQYMWPLVAGSKPEMQTAVVGLSHLIPDVNIANEFPDYPMIMAGVVLVSLVPLVMIMLLQRFLVQGLILSEK
jgi:sn-glycerol 3-phosphate transport system permease protein